MPRHERNLDVEFGEVLRELRRARGYSRRAGEEFAFDAGTGRTYVSCLERGKSSPTLQMLVAHSGPLETRPSEIIRLVEERRF